MTTLPDVEKKITDRYGIAQFQTSAIAKWMDAQSLVFDQWEEIEETASLKATGTLPKLPFLKYQAMKINYSLAFTKYDETLASVLTAYPPDDISVCIPGLSLLVIKDLKLVLTSRMIQLEMSDVSGEPIPFDTLSASFGCTICLDGLNIPILIQFPSGDSNEWLLEGDFSSIRLGGLKQLAGLVGGDAWINSLPTQITQLGNLSINDVRMIFDPTSISLIALEIASDTPLEIIPGKLVLKDPRIAIDIDHPTDPARRSVHGNFSGTVQIGGVGIYLSADVPGMRFYGALAEGSSIDFPGLLSYLGVPLHDAPKFELHDFNLRVDASDPDAKTFSIFARCYSAWNINGVTLTCVQTAVDYDSINGVGANLFSVFSIGGVDVTLSAAHPKGDGGWQFEGSTGAGQEIPIRSLIAGFGEVFEANPELPAQLEDLVIKDLGVSFNTKSKDFKFTCEVDLPVSAQSSLVMQLVIDVKHVDEKAYRFEFSGKFDVKLEDKTLEFKLQFEHIGKAASKTDKLMAVYHHDGKLPLNVSKLLCALVPGDSDLTGLITGLDIAVDVKDIQLAFYKEASEPAKASKSLFGMHLCADVSFSDPFSNGKELTAEINSILFASFDREAANQNDQPKATSKFLFGLKIGAELSLSSVPLVGAQLPAGQDIGVKDLQLFAASQSILPDDLEQVKNLLVSDKLPTPKTEDPAKPAKKLEVGVTVDAILILGAETRNLVFVPSGESPASQEMRGQPGNQVVESSKEAAGLAGVSAQAEKALAANEYNIQPAQPPVKWIKIQKSFGPVRFDRLGFKYQNQVIWFLLDASLSAAGLTISLEGLGFGSRITKFEPRFELQGLGINFKNDPLEISGAFLKTGDYRYSGLALIKARSFMLSAIGAYESVEGKDPSLFVFAYLDTPLGGPPCFYVTGLAAGFGYNSTVRIPAIGEVKDFPLLAAMIDPSKIGIQKNKPANPMAVLASLGEWIKPQPGTYWLAAGITFRSFEIINSNVLAIAEFGKEFQVLVVGLSTILLPKEGKIYAYAELAIQITIKPAQGFIAAMAQLTPNSYLLDPACRLTGGFAFYVWFGNNPHTGDFVLTIGGYHPAFQVPAHYPQPIQVPRLGFNWPVSSEVTIKGEAYFALTPSCVMAGGKLEVLYHSGNLQAWFIAQADVIVYWKPFYFEANIQVRIGVSYRVKIWFIRKTLRVELGASVELWGPPTGGRVHISWWVISFTVSFGAGRQTGLRTVDWGGFKTMLPLRKNGRQAVLPAVVTAADSVPVQPDPELAVIQINVNNGLLQQVDRENGKKCWIVRPDEFTFSIETAVPATEIRLNNQNPVTTQDMKEPPTIGIRPMGIRSITSSLTISICKGDQTDPLHISEWDYDPHTRKMPEAMWGQPVNGNLQPGSKLIENCRVGLQNIRRKPHAAPSGPPKFVMEEAFTYFRISLEYDSNPVLPLSTADTEPATGFPTTNDTLQVIHDTLMDNTVKQYRTSIFQALAELGVNAWTDGDLSTLAANPAVNYEASPMKGTLVPG